MTRYEQCAEYQLCEHDNRGYQVEVGQTVTMNQLLECQHVQRLAYTGNDQYCSEDDGYYVNCLFQFGLFAETVTVSNTRGTQAGCTAGTGACR